MKKKTDTPVIKVVHKSSYRDGGTRRYQDLEGQNYYTHREMDGVFDTFPKHKKAKKLDVELEIVDVFEE